MTGPKLLAEWRARVNLTQKGAAERFGFSQPSLCDYERGKKVPRIDAAIRMAKETGGAVPVESWGTEEEAS